MFETILENLAGELEDPDGSRSVIAVAYSKDIGPALEMRERILERFPDHRVIVDPLSLVVCCHTGPGSLGLTVSRSMIAPGDEILV